MPVFIPAAVVKAMPFVKRDESGNIIAVSAEISCDCQEEVSHDHTELQDFIAKLADKKKITQSAQFFKSDLEFIRIIEDLINILIEKNIICYTDFTPASQKKIDTRRKMRASIHQIVELLDEDDGII